MKRVFRRAVVAGLSALGLLTATVSPAQAATGYDRCPAGRFCLFDNADGTGAMATYSGSMATLGAYDNWAAGMRNRTGLHACVYSQPNHAYTDSVHHVVLQTGTSSEAVDLTPYQDANSRLANNVSSFRLARTSHECMSGAAYMVWYSPSWGRQGVQPLGDFNRDGATDLLFRTVAGALYFQRGDGTATRIGVGWNSMNVLQRHGDRDGDGAEDIVTRDGNGVLWMYPGNGMGGLKPRVQIGVGWSTLRNITTMGDFNGDGRRGDVVTNDSSGRLWLFAGRANGTLEPRKQIGSSGWQGMTALVGAGDVNSDGKNDLVARDGSGNLWLYPGKGTGGVGARKQIGSGWKRFERIIGLGDVNGDGRYGDLYGKDAPLLTLYRNNGWGSLAEEGLDYDWDDRETAF
ncbi:MULTISPECIES: FG-GAP-like repeat-containing protein [Streptomyces]|uniref:FG-GAP-like repeat-containing protein n=1 Tax=Streptomyces solicathayae TaxID=3081768 RepID=A0ABZ0LSJ5_9ACTN|nr:FG-GAP-like repeat-containing protein [Streptomyces sp. HUAS YS2]WOX22426.1 FG-GAP-like repeat-containing protein [Streptomyces sp. HUAS YS2]